MTYSISPKLSVPMLEKARNGAEKARRDLEQLLEERVRGYDSVDTSVVVFGSLARREWTSSSDLDWTYLIDGQANSDHLVIAQKIHQVLWEQKERFRPTGTVGNFREHGI
jgi:predicted nucleotidyltransferase